MQNLQEIHHRLEELKRKRRDLNRMFKDELAQNADYQKIVEQVRVLRERKKSIENTTKLSCFAGTDALDDVRDQIKFEQELLSDVALNMYASGNSVEIVQDETRYLPRFSVKFKKDSTAPAAEHATEAAAERAASHPERTFAPQPA